ncbi:hypothetical protein E2C01_037531 [Portunus trituberculatus]|uniref:Uncharacterized protein n=1 Tax=Portunus trituberculatus TaxID=210409 RepID=A0A5B7FE82_PORTR|nr:hypothetical protein [Portunus trituberculatus]
MGLSALPASSPPLSQVSRDAPIHIFTLPSTTLAPTTTTPQPATPMPQPTTSHAEQRKGNEEEKASLLTIRAALLQNIEKGNEDVERDSEIVMLMKRRLKNLLSSHCSCPDPAFDKILSLMYTRTP